MKTMENKYSKENGLVESLKRPAFWLVALVIILTIGFYLLDIQASWDSSALTLVLNIVFVIIPALIISFIASRSFIRTGAWPVLWMGIGVLTFGLAAVLSNWLRITSSNNATTVYSIVALLAGIFHFFAGYFSVNRVSPKEPGSGRLSALLQIYLIALALIVSVTVVGGLGLLPPFVVAGIGTPIRVMVQVMALSLFLIAGLMLFSQSSRSKSSMLYWYSLGLLLMCLSMVGAILQKTAGAPISWTARGAQYFGGVYLFIAASVILRKARIKALPVDETLADQFTVLSARLKKSEENYLDLFKNMSEGFAVCEMVYDKAGKPVDYRFLSINPVFEKFLGLSKDQITGKTIRAILPNVQPKAIENLEKVASTGDPIHFENFSRDLNKWFDIYAYRSGPGQFGYMALDITERKKAEEKVLEQLQMLEQANVMVRDAEDRIVFWNQGAERIYGYSKQEAVGRIPHELLKTVFPKPLHEIWQELVQNGKWEGELPHTRRDGVKVISYSIWTYYQPDKSHPGMIIEANTDITERKQLEASLKKANEELEERVHQRTAEVLRERQRLFNVLETVPAMVCLLTSDYHVAFANLAFRKMFGESRGRYCYEYCYGQDKPCEFCQSYKVLETGQPHHWEVTTPDGHVIDANDFPFTDTDGTPMVLEMDIDVTEARKAQIALRELNETLEERVSQRTAELENANKELESFSYSVSHDLRTPLRTLDGFSEMVIMDYGDKLDEPGKDYLNRIRKASQTMSQLIDDILKLSRITRAEMHRNEVNLSKMAGSIADELKAAQPGRQAEFIIVPDMLVTGDKALLEILLRNLLENSWKYTGKCPDTHIEMGVNRQDGKMVYFIKDNGIGFDMQYKDKLFQPFQRLHSLKEYPGTGIGLATAQRVIRRHGGQIWTESEVGKGATFYFTLD